MNLNLGTYVIASDAMGENFGTKGTAKLIIFSIARFFFGNPSHKFNSSISICFIHMLSAKIGEDETRVQGQRSVVKPAVCSPFDGHLGKC